MYLEAQFLLLLLDGEVDLDDASSADPHPDHVVHAGGVGGLQQPGQGGVEIGNRG